MVVNTNQSQGCCFCMYYSTLYFPIFQFSTLHRFFFFSLANLVDDTRNTCTEKESDLPLSEKQSHWACYFNIKNFSLEVCKPMCDQVGNGWICLLVRINNGTEVNNELQ